LIEKLSTNQNIVAGRQQELRGLSEIKNKLKFSPKSRNFNAFLEQYCQEATYF
jgi:hypothetical protein